MKLKESEKGMEGNWAYNERGNMRRKALKRVEKLVEGLQNEQEADDAKMEVSPDTEISGDEQEPELSEKLESDDCSRFDDSDEVETNQDDHARNLDLQSSLVEWAIQFSILLIAWSSLLSILQCHHPHLPKDG